MRKSFVFLVMFFSFAVGCAKETPEVPAPQTVNVATAPVEVREVPDTVQAVGTVEAKDEAVLSAKIMGVIEEIRVDEGSKVKKGETLLRIDAADIQARKQEAEQAKAEGEAALRETEAAADEARAALDNADINLERMQNLYKEQAITKKELDDMTTQHKMAEAKAAQVDARKRQVEAKVAQAEAAIKQADVMLGYSVIVSPISGVVTAKMANKGEMAAPGRPLLKVLNDKNLRLSATVNESGMSGIRKGESVKVTVDALPKRELTGRVTEIVPAADPATRSFGVKIGLPAGQGLLPGMFGRAYLPVGTRKAVLVPSGSLIDKEGMSGVYVVTPEGTLRFQAVRLGGEVEGMRECLSGLSGGEKVVVGELGSLREGMKAAVK